MHVNKQLFLVKGTEVEHVQGSGDEPALSV